MNILDVTSRAKELHIWLAHEIAALYIPNTDRARIAVGIIDIALDHHVAIGQLCETKLYGSALALLRLSKKLEN